jgi:hypothetical protein
MNAFFIPRSAFALALLALFSGLVGCQSPSGKSRDPGFAAVAITNRTAPEILNAAVAVFEADGFRSVVALENEMVFEKAGSGWNQAAYGGWTDAKRVTVRVRGGIQAQSPGMHRLWCDAFMVGDAGHPLFEEQHKLTRVRRGPYQDLLDRVAERLK